MSLAVIRLVVIANPDNGDSPTIYERHGIDSPTQVELHTEEGLE